MDDESDDRRCDALGRAGTGTGGAIGLGLSSNGEGNFFYNFLTNNSFCSFVIHRRVAVHLEDS